jgi:membrane-associated phospholipid phosphatase
LRARSIWALGVAYVVLMLTIIVANSPVLQLDHALYSLHLRSRFPEFRHFLLDYVMLGQRGPATLALLPVFFLLAWTQRSRRPLVLMATGLVWLNVTVGIAKYGIGRIGPFYQGNAHDVFVWGGDIFPSGHVSNAVVMYGLLAWAAAPRFRKPLIWLAAFVSITVGLSTVYLSTHWFSDVMGGWLAGGLVLLTLPSLLPAADRCAEAAIARVRSWRTVRAASETLSAAAGRPLSEMGHPARHRVRRTRQGIATPVSSVAFAHKALAMASSRDAFDEPTRRG